MLMVDAKDDKYEGQDEGEYHFSDDQFNYDMEQESPKPSTAAPVASSDFKQNLMGKLGQHRRLLIGGLVSLVLFFIIYKMLTPATTTQTEFSPVTTQAKTAAKAPMQETQAAVPAQPVQPSQAPASQMPSQAMQPQPQQASPTPMLNPESMNTATPQPMNMPSQNPTMMPPSAAPAQGGTQQQPSMPQQQMMAQQQSTMPTQVPEMGNPQTKNVMDRLAVVEEQNAKIMSLMQTQFAQKIAEYESQTVSSQEKIHVLTKRMANMEATLNKMAQLMQDQGVSLNRTPAVSGNPGLPPAKVIEPKMVYSVQAIIPGRAWLNPNSGDTVTVAEGDMLKDYGRVTKIDPYDGIVDIDTGNKIITLSYGSANE